MEFVGKLRAVAIGRFIDLPICFVPSIGNTHQWRISQDNTIQAILYRWHVSTDINTTNVVKFNLSVICEHSTEIFDKGLWRHVSHCHAFIVIPFVDQYCRAILL